MKQLNRAASAPLSIILTGGAEDDDLNGTPDADSIRGGAGDDILNGMYGDDTLKGEAGNDELFGSNGNDKLLGGEGNDYLIGGQGHDVLNGGLGIDRAKLDLGASGAIDASGFTPGATVGLAVGAWNVTLLGVEALEIFGSSGADTLIGSSGDDRLAGDGNADRLDGGDGNDRVRDLAGSSTIYGGGGDDEVEIGLASTTGQYTGGHDIVYGGDGQDVLALTSRSSQPQLTTGWTGDQFTLWTVNGAYSITAHGVEALDLGGGILADTLIGGSGADTLDGGDGADTLVGGQGDDALSARTGDWTMSGGAGEDLLTFSAFAMSGSSVGGVSRVDGGEGHDVLRAEYRGSGYEVSVSWIGDQMTMASSDGAYSMVAEGVEALDLDLGWLDDTIVGGAGDDRIRVFGGANYADGAGGDDWIETQGDADTFIGGAGDDTIILGLNTATVDGGAGYDRLGFSWRDEEDYGAEPGQRINYAGFTGDGATAEVAYSGFEAVWVEGTYGEDTIIGSARNDALDGSMGADLVFGGDGDDSFIQRLWIRPGASFDAVDLADTLDGGRGTDTLSYAEPPARLDGFGLIPAIQAVEVSLAEGTAHLVGLDSIDTVRGFEAVIGSDGADTIAGARNKETLEGRAGDDQLTGLAGNDRMRGDEGNDRVDGGFGKDVMDGGEGADTLIGSLGRDRMTGGEGADSFAFLTLNDIRVADTISDLEAGDVIDLSLIDANAAKAGNQAFNLAPQFTHKAGQAVLAHNEARGFTDLLLDVDGDAVADASIRMAGEQTDFTGWVL